MTCIDFDTEAAPLLSGELTAIDGETVHRIPLTGRDGTGSFALVDAAGLQRLRSAGARFLYLVSDGHGNRYAAFLQMPSRCVSVASRVIIDAPSRRRVIYVNGDHLDLRAANLMIQPRKEERRPKGRKAAEVNDGWISHRALRRREAGTWKRTVRPTNVGGASE